ncbi:MAG: DUF4845 domain-containing protein [Aquimonas sp.]|nr:DUF4845 domain-containing protein [Aquimonas sp.]
MQSRRHQRGITLLGLIVVLAIFGFFAYTVMRLAPMYYQYYNVVTAMRGVSQEPGVGTMTPERIRILLGNRFNISYVEVVQPRDFVIQRTPNGFNLTIKYEDRRPFAYNIDVVATFEKTVELNRQGSTN